MATGRFVAYYRVSTARQGRSGLGLEAQREAVTQFLNGGHWELVAEFTEVESGRKNDRPELQKALTACRAYGATLVIAKLDRLARNVHFISGLMESGVEFVAADFPQANRLTVHMLAAVAEYEREQISKRTKSALAAAKARGVRLGNPSLQRGTPATASHARAAHQTAADQWAENLRPVVEDVAGQEGWSPSAIASALNERGVPTRRGGRWQTTSAQRLLKRLIEASGKGG